MKNLTALMLATSLMSLSQIAFSETAKHFEGKSLESIEEALEVFKEYNEQFEAKLNTALDPLALHEIHEMSYTMENALGYIANTINTIAEDLESVHKASEHANPERVKEKGSEYLKLSRTVIK